jgi:hypothetical protein
MAVIIGNILGGPVLLKRALAKAGNVPESRERKSEPVES